MEHGGRRALPDGLQRDEGKCLACCATLKGDLVIEAEIDEDPDAENLPVQDFSGVVSRIETLTRPSGRGSGSMRRSASRPGNINLNLPGGIGSQAFSPASPPSASGEVELNIPQRARRAGHGLRP